MLPLIRWSHNIFSYASFITHDGWCSLNDESVFCFFLVVQGVAACLIYYTLYSSDNKTNDSFTEFFMWFIITAMTYSTNITNLILLQSSREKLEFFHLVYPSRTCSHCSGFHQGFASFILGLGSFTWISFGEVLTIHGNQSWGLHSGVCLLCLEKVNRSGTVGKILFSHKTDHSQSW